MINQQRLLDSFMNLVQIDCPTGAERQVGDVVKKQLAELGLEIAEDDAGCKINGNCGNIYGYLKGNAEAPVIMLSAHLDCVDPCTGVKPEINEGIITSSGDTVLGADDKAGVAAMLEALQVIREADLKHGDIQVVLTVAEESGLKGSKNVDRSKLKADFGYALDSSGSPGSIIIKAPGENQIKVTIHGKTAHAGIAPEEGINAIVVAGKALAEIKQGRIDEETTANVGIIKGGKATNIVPDKVELTCEARSRDMDKLANVVKYNKEVFERVAADNGASADIHIEQSYTAFSLTEDLPVVKLAVKAGQNAGLAPETTATGGGSDANVFNSYGIPTAVLGMGMSKVHTTEEFIKVEDLYNSAEWVAAIITEAALIR